MVGSGPLTLTCSGLFVSRVQMMADVVSTSQILMPVAWWTGAGVAAKVGLTASDTTVNRQGFIAGITGDTSQLVNLAMSTPPGGVVGPITAGDAAVVFQVVEQKRVTDQELKQSEASYMDMLRAQQARSLRAALLGRLRKEAKVDVNEQVLQQSRSTQSQQG